MLLLALLAASFTGLNPQEENQLVEGLVSEQLCSVYISDDSKRYLLDLKFKASRNNYEISEWLRGVLAGTLERQIKYNYEPTLKECKVMLPKAFEQLELLKRLGDGTRN